MTPRIYTGGPVSTNGYLLETPDGLLVIDAPEGIAEEVRATGLAPVAVLLTHLHFDHVGDVAELTRMGARIYAYAPWSEELILTEAARRWGLSTAEEPFTVDELLKGQLLEGTGAGPLQVAGVELELRHVPGHSPDSLVYVLPALGLAFGGDTLFAGSIGRTDLPGGGHRQLLDAIREQLLTLPPTTRILPGHGPETSIAQEVASNPHLR